MKALSLILLMAAVIMAPGHVAAANLDDAHAAFAAAKYKESTAGYQAEVDQRGYSAPVLYDLGNSLYREGSYAAAILAYKRALLLAPGDADIEANLQAAQKQAGLPGDAPAPMARFTGFLSESGWAWTACAAWTLLCAGLLIRVVAPAARLLATSGSVVCAGVLAVALLAIVAAAGNLRDAVVMDKDAAALISPFPAAQTLFTPAAGETVKMEKSYNEFVLIRDSEGHAGWIAKDRISPLIPSA